MDLPQSQLPSQSHLQSQSQPQTVVGGQTGLAIPLIIAVTGHRDLVPEEIPLIRRRVSKLLLDLQKDYPDRGVSVMSALAEGADQLVANEALRLDIPLIVPLPMPKALYLKDFDNAEVRENFERLLSQAAEVYELPLTEGHSLESISTYGDGRDQQYAQLGVFVCAHCHILLALWDGKYNEKLGGTGQVVRFHHDDIMPGYTKESAASGLILADDESDLVYHIVCSRDCQDGQPEALLTAGDYWWFSLDEKEPRSKQLPESHRRVFQYTSEFSADALMYADNIQNSAYPLLDEQNRATLPPGLGDIDHIYRAADWLAGHFQSRVLLTLKVTHLLAILMGLMYIAYSDLLPIQQFLYAFLSFFLIASAILTYSKRRAWHRKYLDYRTLAEGLRVQFYWAAAGVMKGHKSKYTHDTFLQTQDPDLGWIRNVMRISGTECDASNYSEPAGLEFTLSEWLGDYDTGQLGYFRRKGAECTKRYKRTERLTTAALWIGFAAITFFVMMSADLGEQVRDPLVILMGIMLLFVGVWQSYSFGIADAELIKQYEFMYQIFCNARRRIDSAVNDHEKRRVLQTLGDAALGEHSQWILMHRERAPNQNDMFNMG
ncbi:MAG: hypothetical protein KUG75_01105 [Pseudomonadales bacterium]|nr:hypothetical protein [Pseudomonadales bacterium]